MMPRAFRVDADTEARLCWRFITVWRRKDRATIPPARDAIAIPTIAPALRTPLDPWASLALMVWTPTRRGDCVVKLARTAVVVVPVAVAMADANEVSAVDSVPCAAAAWMRAAMEDDSMAMAAISSATLELLPEMMLDWTRMAMDTMKPLPVSCRATCEIDDAALPAASARSSSLLPRRTRL